MQAERTADTNGRKERRKEGKEEWLAEGANGKEFQKNVLQENKWRGNVPTTWAIASISWTISTISSTIFTPNFIG